MLRVRAVLPGLVLALGLAACGGSERSQRAPTLLFAVDGLEWDVLLPLVQRGEAPAFAELMARGVFGELQTLKPTWSPVIWTTIATGKGPEKHGIEGFVYAAEVDGQMEPRVFNSGHRRTKAFWNILSQVRNMPPKLLERRSTHFTPASPYQKPRM